MRRLALLGLTLVAAAAGAVALTDGDGAARTSTPALVGGLVPGVEVVPLISTGDALPGGYVFESIPDGIAVHRQSATKISGKATARYVRHRMDPVEQRPQHGKVRAMNGEQYVRNGLPGSGKWSDHWVGHASGSSGGLWRGQT